MITGGPKQARDEILAIFRNAWLGDPKSMTVPVLWPDVAGFPPNKGSWARLKVTHSAGRQATLGGEVGQRRFRRDGIVYVQIFTDGKTGQVTSDELSFIAMRAFEGKVTLPGRVIFRNVRLNEVGQDGQWFQVNVLVEFEYDEIH